MNPALPFKVLDEHVETTGGQVSVSTIHLAKGLEFRLGAVMGCDDEVITLQSRISAVAENQTLAGLANARKAGPRVVSSPLPNRN